MNNSITFNNRGMLLEKIINNSINFYIKNNIAFFNKKNLDIKFKKINKNNNLIENAFIMNKSTVDYYGIYQGKYISFEAKSTELNYFPLANIKQHQHQHLCFIKSLGGVVFYLIYFKKSNEIFLVDIDLFDFKNKKTISYEEIVSTSIKLDLIFPGIIDFLSFLK